ncbi:MAG: hypothetical protein IJN63_03530 [Clostridia bacterium]|nr:hypothetical protein [Clostridia bacterium]
MSNLFPHLLGNEHLKELIAADIRRGTFLHACILESEKGNGIEDSALDIAAAIACKNKESDLYSLPCGRCPSCEKILNRNCIDMITIDKGDKASIGVDRIRELKQNTVLSASELDCKIYMILEADKMTEEAQNALLKILEEPPIEETYFLLCTENSEALLPTVRSRAPVMRLTPPTRSVTAAIIEAEFGVGSEEAYRAATAAGNGIALAREIIRGTDDGKARIKAYDQARAITEMLATKRSKSDIILYISSLSLKKEEATEILRLIYSGLRDIIAVKRCRDIATDLYPTAEEARKYAGRITARGAVAISDAVSNALSSLDKNASPKNVMLAFAVEAHNALFG